MRGPVFVDSAGWLAALCPRFEHHTLALSTLGELREAGASLLTTNLVVAEVHGMLAGRVSARLALENLDHAYADPAWRVVHVDAELQQAAVDRWLRVYRDMPFSLCDAVSFEVMRREGLRQAFTLDLHFALAGYDVVPVVKKLRRRR